MNKPDEVDMLIYRIQMMYDAAKALQKDFKDMDEYEVLDVIVKTLKAQPKKPKLKVVT